MKKSNNDLVIAIFVVILVGICLVFFLFSDNDGGKPKEPDTIDAVYMCKQFVTDQLKSPSTADFQNMYDAKVEEVSSNVYQVVSYVDAQNSFGAMLRTTYFCKVEFVGNDQWKLLDLRTDP